MGEGVGKHWQLLNFSIQLGTASQVWVVRPFLGKPAAGKRRPGVRSGKSGDTGGVGCGDALAAIEFL